MEKSGLAARRWCLVVVSVLAGASCEQPPQVSGATDGRGVGSISVGLTLAPGETLATASYDIKGPGGFDRTGTIDVSQAATLSAVIGGLPVGRGFTITVMATTADGSTTCMGSATFDVAARATTAVSLHLTCHEAPRTGSVFVNGSINICPQIDGVSASPAEAFVGSPITLSVIAHDSDRGPRPLSYRWSASMGELADPTSQTTTLVSPTEGTVNVSVRVSDGDPILDCIASVSIPNFIKFQKRSVQSEARANLKAIYTAEKAFIQEKDHYSDLIDEIGFEPERGNLYRYVLTAFPKSMEDRSGTIAVHSALDQAVDVDVFKYGSVLGVTLSGSPCVGSQTWGLGPGALSFTAAAYGQIDADGTIDVWTISSDSRTLSGAGCDGAGNVASGEPTNDVNDVNH